jgi:chemotaxis protein methyltransferase CheR
VDLLTTNETCFFREPKHFAFLAKQLRERGGTAAPFRVWSAASSTGEEAYSIAMLLEDHIPGRWEVLGSDISGRALDRARAAHYSMARIENLPPQYLQRFCLKGQGAQDGTFLIDELVRESVQFLQINLNTTLPAIGQFDVVFLRNVLIYFNLHTKRGVVSRVLNTIKPGGYLLIGHSDSLAQMDGSIRSVAPSIYRKLS